MLEIPSLPDSEAEADWAELSCLLEEKSTISRSEIETRLEEANVDDIERVIGNIWQQINWRRSEVPGRHPIDASLGFLKRVKTWKQSFVYAFMLLLSSNSFYENTQIKSNQWTKISKLFEKAVTEAMRRYLGSAINIGAPRKEGVPASFDKCLDYVCQLTKERKGPKDPRSHWRKDAGVDVISWNPLDDRSGQVVVLIQCAAGGKWGKKGSDINLKRWNKLIHFAADPIRALAFPDVCPTTTTESKNRWLDYSWDGGILLDRLRIASLVSITGKSVKPLRSEIVDWSEEQIEKLTVHSER